MKSPTSFRIGDGVGRTKRSGTGGAPGPGVGRERARCGCPDSSVAGAMACLPLMAGSLGGFRPTIYRREPPERVTRVTRLRVIRPAADRSRAATRVAADRDG